MKEAKVKNVFEGELFFCPERKAFYRRLKDKQADDGQIFVYAEPANRQGPSISFHPNEKVVV